jgi:hypothetical protein
MCDISQFYKTKLDNFIKVCYEGISSKESEFPTFKPINNPIINEIEQCLLLNNKKQDYYKHTYNPQKIIDNVSNYTINENFKVDDQFKSKYIDNMIKIIDMTPRESCCNCISFTLYSTAKIETEEEILKRHMDLKAKDEEYDYFFTDSDSKPSYETLYEDLERLCGYLLCLKISVMNIKKRLEDFVVRIYLDISVISVINKFNEIKMEYVRDKEKLEKYKKNILEYIQYLFSADNVEIYTYLCESYLQNIAKIRALRFLPMLDPEVNVSIVREADGIVSYTDIFNIKNFVTSNKMIFIYSYQPKNFIDPNITNILYNFTETAKIPTYLSNTEIERYFLPYSQWLREYIKDNEYFTNKRPLFDLLAGLFGIKIKVRQEIFMESIHNVNINNNKKIKEKELEIELQKDVDTKTSMIKSLDTFKLAMRIGFDEMFLMELFKDLYTYNIKYDLKEYDYITIANIMFILNNFQYPLKKITTNIKNFITSKLILDTLFGTDTNNRKIYRNIPHIQNEINMYIMDYNIDYIIKSENITESCIDIQIMNYNDGDDMKISNILNNLLTKNILNDRKNWEYRSVIIEYGQNFNIDEIVFKLYNEQYNFYSILNGGYKQKYEKYKKKYLNLKNIQNNKLTN